MDEIRILDPIFRFWNRNIDILIFVIAGDLLVVSYQAIPNAIMCQVSRYLDSKFGSDHRFGFRIRIIEPEHIYFLKFAISAELLVLSKS